MNDIVLKSSKIDNEVFLKNLVELAKLYGWTGDFSEICTFVKWSYATLGVSMNDVDLTPNDD